MGNVNARQFQNEPSSSSSDEPINMDSIDARVVCVTMDGVDRTKDSLLQQNIEKLFKIENFEELILTAQDIRNNLLVTGCFSEVDINLDTFKEGGSKDYIVTYKVKELNRISGGFHTLVGDEEGSLLAAIKMPNFWGGGERLQLDYTHGTSRNKTLNLSYMKPFFGKSQTTLTSSIFQQITNLYQSGYKEMSRGTAINFGFLSGNNISHSLQWEGVWRQLHSFDRTCPFKIREEAGHNLKSSIRHILTIDKRDEAIFPSSGSLFKLCQEYAGLGGNVGFFKNEMEIQTNLEIFNDVVFQGSFNCGFLKELSDKQATISDRYFVGGPLNIRGFNSRGIGNIINGYPIGGNSYWSSGLHLFTPLPSLPPALSNNTRAHLFINAGNLGNFQSNNIQDNIEELKNNFRLSYGFGLALKLGGIARFELNYCIPVKSNKSDKLAPGLQFGLGVVFL